MSKEEQRCQSCGAVKPIEIPKFNKGDIVFEKGKSTPMTFQNCSPNGDFGECLLSNGLMRPIPMFKLSIKPH
jgi:hypothetical protein